MVYDGDAQLIRARPLDGDLQGVAKAVLQNSLVVGFGDADGLDAAHLVQRLPALAERDGQHLERRPPRPALGGGEPEAAGVNVDERADEGAGLRVVAEEGSQADAYRAGRERGSECP